MTSRDNNRVVRPFEWGLEWANQWPTLDERSSAAGPDRQGRDDGILDRGQPARHRQQRRVLCLQDAHGFPHRASQGGIVPHRQRAAQEAAQGRVGQVPALHLGGGVAVSGEQLRERALVSRARTSRRDFAAAVERRRRQPERSVPHLQHAGHRRAAPEHAVPRHPASRGTDARRLRGSVQHRAHHPRWAAGDHRHPLLPRLAASSAATRGWASSAPVSARATRFWRARTIRASASASSITPPPPSATWPGRANPPSTSGRAWKPCSPRTKCGACGCASAPSCTSTSSGAGPRSR